LPDLDGSPEIVALRAQIRAARTETLQRITAVSVASLIALSAIATVLGWLLAGQALRPLRRITATARGIADRNLHQRIALDGPEDEIKQLADTLDDMLERLDRAFDSQQRFIANASHELRTPLAINRTLIEVAMMKEARPDAPLLQLGSTLLAVNQRHERLIDGLLMLASSEQEIAHPQVLDLTAIAEQVLRQSAEMARLAAIEVRSQLESATCRGDPVLIERLLQNLVDNAIRYNVPASGWVRVNTGTDATGRATISVENTGPLIPSYELPRLFEPFRRLSSTERVADSSGALGRRGAGLGLSIVRAIVASHGGQLDALAREEGGLLIRISLPAHNS
jgi:signal transduction histidine kinase